MSAEPKVVDAKTFTILGVEAACVKLDNGRGIIPLEACTAIAEEAQRRNLTRSEWQEAMAPAQAWLAEPAPAWGSGTLQ